MNKYQKVVNKVARYEMEEWNKQQPPHRRISFYYSRKVFKNLFLEYEEIKGYKDFFCKGEKK